MRHKALIFTMAVSLLPLLIAAEANALGASQDSPTRVYVVPGYPGEESGSSYLGVDTCDVTKENMASLKLNKEEGVEVTMVDQDAPAGKAGLKEHDVILTLNGENVESVEQLKRMIHEIPPGRDVTLGISRNGQALTLKATLANRRFAMHFPVPPVPAVPPVPPIPAMPEMDFPSVVVHYPSRAGLIVENLTPQLGDFFGVKNGEGVLIRSVQRGSVAEASGFKAGDVIVRVGNTRIHDTSDWRMAMRDHRSGTVSIGVIREKHEQTLSLKLPERQQSRNAMEEPSIDANVDLSALQDEMAKLQPELQKMQAEIMSHQQEWRAETQKAWAQAAKEMQRQQKTMQEELKKQQKTLQEQMKKMQEDIRRGTDEL